MYPGPQCRDVLCDQDKHRSQRVWDEGYSSNNLLHCRRVEDCVKRVNAYDTRMDIYLHQSGFYGVARLSFIQFDWALITALVERWRPETHSFHMHNGEMTVTLEDVAIQLGLPINGEAVIGSTSLDWSSICRRLLGAVPKRSDISFGRLKMKWLATRFKKLPNNATSEQVRQFTRAFILQLIGGMVFADKSQSRVHLMYLPLLESFDRAGGYSWGSACLSWLFKQLCRAACSSATQIAGPLILLQIWAWDHFPHIAPRRRRFLCDDALPLAHRWSVEFDVKAVGTHVLSQYREVLDRQTEGQVVWRPYTEEILYVLPSYCVSSRDLWMARVPLICFHVVEWHYPDRVLKQFGGDQTIPTAKLGSKHKDLHSIDLRGRYSEHWSNTHREFIFEWNSRRLRLVSIDRSLNGNYAQWYEMNSRPTISHTGTMLRHLSRQMQEIGIIAEKGDPSDLDFIRDEVRRCRELLETHIAVRLHGRNDDEQQRENPVNPVEPSWNVVPVVRQDEMHERNVPEDTVGGECSGQSSRILEGGDEFLISQLTAVAPTVPFNAASSSRPKRRKCNANRGRLLG